MFWIVWSRGGIQALSFLATLIVARFLSPSDYGVVALATVWTSTIHLLADTGLGATIVQFHDLEDREINGFFWLMMAIACGGYLALYVAAPAIAAWFDTPALADVLRVLGLALPLNTVSIVPDGLLRREVALDRISQIEIVSMLATILVTVSCAWSGLGMWSLVAGGIVGPMTSSFVTFLFAPWRPGLRIASKRAGALMHFSLATLGTRILSALRDQSDIFIVGMINGAAATGLYSMAGQLAAVPANKISTAVNLLGFPVMAQLQHDPHQMVVTLLRALRLVACAVMPACFGLMVVADDLVGGLLGETWMPIVPILQALCLLAAVRSLTVLLPPILFARRRQTFLLWYSVALLPIVSSAFLAGTLWRGPLAGVIFVIPAYLLLALRMAREVVRELDLSWKLLGRQICPSLGAALIMVGVVAAARGLMPPEAAMHAIVHLFSLTLTGAAAYALSLQLIGGPVVAEMKEVASWILGRGHADLKS